MINYDEEILDIVDAGDNVIEQITRTDYYAAKPRPGFVRAVNLFLINSEGKIWVPRRAATQKIKPNALDFSAGGHVSAGESYEQSLIREIAEEIGLQVNSKQLIYLGKLPPEDIPGREDYFSACYVYYSDETPDYPAEEFSNDEWLLPAELAAKIDSGEDAKDSIKDALELLLRYQTEQHGNG